MRDSDTGLNPRRSSPARLIRDERRIERLILMYERLRRCNADVPGDYDGDGKPVLPPIAKIRQVEAAALGHTAQDSFFRSLLDDADLDKAAVTAVRDLLEARGANRARSFAQVLQQGELRRAGDICMALVGLSDAMPETAWTLFGRHDLADVLRLAPAEYFRLGFTHKPQVAVQILGEVVRGGILFDTEAAGWLDIARTSFAAGAEGLSRWALDRAEQRLGAVLDPERAESMSGEIAWLAQWYGRAARATEEVPVPAGEIPFAILDYRQPDKRQTSSNVGDYVQTVAALGHLVRRSGLRFTGESELVEIVEALRGRVKRDRILEGDDATMRLYRVDRDATNYSTVPPNTWLIAFGWYMHPMFGIRFDLPFNPRLRPLFISFHIDAPALVTSELIDYLCAHGPIGCRDWYTVLLLKAAGVPAFFSGCLTTTVDTVFPPEQDPQPSGTLYVDTAPTGNGDTAEQEFEAVRTRGLFENIADVLKRVQSYRGTYAQVATSRLHCYLPARSIGAHVDFRPKNPGDLRFEGLVDVTDEDFDAMRTGILDKLSVVLAAIASGKSTDEVYAVWRGVCAADVQFADARLRVVDDIAEPRFDVAEACRTIRAESVTVQRCEPAPLGAEMNLELSLDGNLKQQLCVVLDSVVSRASRPIRAHILCRDHGPADFARLAEQFPTVSFVWLPTDRVEYGEAVEMKPYITVATMDRLLLPELLPEVDRILHLDIDTLCLADLAELYDIDLGGNPIAARTAPQPQNRSRFQALARTADGIGGDPALAREFLLRTLTRHRFDVTGFNAGVLVLDLDRMRADSFCRHYLPYAERFGLNDQGILNAYAAGRRVEIDPDWNRFPRLEVVAEPKIVHWAGPLKPWGEQYVWGRALWQAADAALSARLTSRVW